MTNEDKARWAISQGLYMHNITAPPPGLIDTILDEIGTAGLVIVERPDVDLSQLGTPAPARRRGPASSRIAAEWRPTRGALAYRLLEAHVLAWRAADDAHPYLGFTNTEVARIIGIEPYHKSCPHHRHGDLADHGFLQTVRFPDGREVMREVEGEWQEIRILQDRGVALYDELGPSTWKGPRQRKI